MADIRNLCRQMCLIVSATMIACVVGCGGGDDDGADPPAVTPDPPATGASQGDSNAAGTAAAAQPGTSAGAAAPTAPASPSPVALDGLLAGQALIFGVDRGKYVVAFTLRNPSDHAVSLQLESPAAAASDVVDASGAPDAAAPADGAQSAAASPAPRVALYLQNAGGWRALEGELAVDETWQAAPTLAPGEEFSSTLVFQFAQADEDRLNEGAPAALIFEPARVQSPALEEDITRGRLIVELDTTAM